MFNGSLSNIIDIILDERKALESLQATLDELSQLFSDITAITPDASFDAWAEDSFLENGVAINPQAAAYCIKDYQRSIAFIRGVNAAIKEAKNKFPSTRINILYAGCGPFATLLMPLLVKFKPDELEVSFLDIHQQSLDSVETLLRAFGLQSYKVNLIQGDACRYQHGNKLHIIVAEVMQKALEQEPQVAATANLAPQLYEQGIFIPEKIEVQLCLAHWEDEKALLRASGSVDSGALERSGMRHSLGELLLLQPSSVNNLMKSALLNPETSVLELKLKTFRLPEIDNLEHYDLLMLTRIKVFSDYVLGDYESEITLPHKCYDVSLLSADLSYSALYQLGSYPRFHLVADWLSVV
ncbi:hypothetical protein [Alkalimarinus sediminis]|uniref:Phytanoyl-CoA dioxygenase n=1 Tax=Alkalimarinus sediminis TaxID=1632866 RepID=A0A9E8KQ94_9ALTE|nr:hypothetical protein [Alkalimarinus sediminis]UZW74422.1 hypothetical protein NNL22_15565 [Alkalimarinus sediminis]